MVRIHGKKWVEKRVNILFLIVREPPIQNYFERYIAAYDVKEPKYHEQNLRKEIYRNNHTTIDVKTKKIYV